MSYTLPSRDSRQWRFAQNGDSFGVITASKNVDADDEGYIKLAPRTVAVASNTDDTDFDRVVAINYHDSERWIFTDDDNFTIAFDSNAPTQDAETGAFTSTSDSVVYGTTQWASATNSANLFYRSTGAWSTLGASLTTSKPHPLCVFESTQQLAVGDGNKVRLVTTPDGTPAMSGTILTIPAKHTVTSLAYNNSKLFIGTKTTTGNAYLFIWDASDANADFGFPVPTNYVASVAVYESTVALLTAQGQILRFTGNGFETLANLPVYYSGLDWSQFNSSTHTGHRSLVSDGSLLYVSITNWNQRGFPFGFPDKRDFIPDNTPSGVWVYDPSVGLYHRHSPSTAKRTVASVTTGNVNTTTDVITVSSAPNTGTPVVVVLDSAGDWGSNILSDNIYYAIKISPTTLKLASTRANAQSSTSIDITAALATVKLFWFPETDFGQYLSESCLCVEPHRNEDGSAQWWETSRVLFGGDVASATNISASLETLNTAIFNIHNRGYFVTSKIQAESITEGTNNVYIRFKPLASAEDKIIVKYRGQEKANFPIRYVSITWTDGDTFTTTDTRFTNAVVGNEIEFMAGRGAGCLAHISSVSESGGTYTVNLDESIPEVSASDVSVVNVDNWNKKLTISTSTITNEKGFAKVPISARDSVFHQIKVEMRGADIAIREFASITPPSRGL